MTLQIIKSLVNRQDMLVNTSFFNFPLKYLATHISTPNVPEFDKVLYHHFILQLLQVVHHLPISIPHIWLAVPVFLSALNKLSM